MSLLFSTISCRIAVFRSTRDNQPVGTAELRNGVQKIIARKRNASFSGHIIRARNMEKDGAPLSLDHRGIIEPYYNDQVIHAVIPPKPFIQCRVWQTNQPVVVRISWYVAPRIVGLDLLRRKYCPSAAPDGRLETEHVSTASCQPA